MSTRYRITGYIRSRNFRKDTGKLSFESFIFVYAGNEINCGQQ